MNEMKEYTLELKKHFNCKKEMSDLTTLEQIHNYVVEMTELYLQSYEKRDLNTIRNLLDEQRHMRKELTKELRECEYQAIVISGKLVQTYNIFNKLLQYETQSFDFEHDMKIIERSHKHVGEVLQYLYKHMHVQHKTLRERFGIAASTLSDLMNALEKVECIEKLKCGKFTYYNLTNEGRRYIKSLFPEIDNEVVVDVDQFKSEVQNIVDCKENISFSEKENNYHRVYFQKNCSFDGKRVRDKWELDKYYAWIQIER